MTDFKSGQTVYDQNGKSFEFHHEHGGVAFCYPLYEFQDGDGEWFEVPSEHLVGLSRVFAEAPVAKVEETLAKLIDQVKEKQQEVNRAHGEAMKVRSQLSKAEFEFTRYMEENGFMIRLGKMMAGEPMTTLVIFSGDWIPPQALGTRELQALKMKYQPDKKVWRFAKPRGYNRDGDDTLEIFDNVEQANDFVSVMFEKLCKEVSSYIRNKPAEVFDPARNYSTPHIDKLRGWIKKWPHLEMPDALLEAEQAYLDNKRNLEIEAAQKRLKELQNG